MKKLLLALALLFVPSLAQAQCNGIFPANTVCGTIAGGTPRAVAPSGFSAGLTVGVTTVTGGTNTRVLFDNTGLVGEYTNAQLTALIQLATTGLSGALPAWPNNTTTFFRGDGTYTGITCGALPPLTADLTTSGCASTLATVNANTGSWGTATQTPTITVNAKGLVTAAANTTITPAFTSITGQATASQLPTLSAKTVLANTSNGASTPLENSISAVLDMLGSTQGSVIYRDAAAWQLLSPGTSGQLLQSGGAAANPSWTTASGTGTVTSVANDGTIKSSVASNGAITATGTLSLWGEPGTITNCILQGTVGANALTVSLVTQSGATPTATAPCTISFGNPTVTIGDYTLVKVTAATTFVTGATGSTFGSTNSTPFRLWVVAFSGAGTPVLGIFNTSDGSTGISPIDETSPQSSTACSACTTANLSSTYYTTAAKAAQTIRILGYMDWSAGLATAGVWASGPTSIRLMGPGVHKPGDIVQTKFLNDTTVFTSSSASFVDITGLTLSITPTATPNPVLVQAQVNGSSTSATSFTGIQLLRGGTSIDVGAVVGSRTPVTSFLSTPSGFTSMITATPVVYLDFPNTATSTTYKFQGASGFGGAASAWSINAGVVDTNTAGFGRTASTIILQELMR